MTIIQVDQAHAGFYFEGLTLEEIRDVIEREEKRAEEQAAREGWKRTPGCSTGFHIFETNERPRVPWAHAQWSIEEEGGKASFDGSDWDSSGQNLVEYAVLSAFISLFMLPAVRILGDLLGGS